MNKSLLLLTKEKKAAVKREQYTQSGNLALDYRGKVRVRRVGQLISGVTLDQ